MLPECVPCVPAPRLPGEIPNPRQKALQSAQGCQGVSLQGMLTQGGAAALCLQPSSAGSAERGAV